MSTSLARSRVALTLIAALGSLGAGSAWADDYHRDRERAHEHMDAHFNHNHAYLERGSFVHVLPRERLEVVARGPGGGHFFFYGGVWYAPRGPGFVVVGAPLGLFIPVLPAFYTTLWVGGLPYYYANDTYYAYRGPAAGYEVVAAPDQSMISMQAPPGAAAPPPPGDPPSAGPPSAGAVGSGDQVFIYPKNGQSEDQQAKDRYECHRWASGQSGGYDPTAAGGGVPPDQAGARHADYQRALSACLEGRGYSVK